MSRQTKKQDTLLATVIQDAFHDEGPADHQQNSMWDYLKKYKNNYTTSSLPQKTRSNASTDKRIWKQDPATLNSLNWHSFRFALGHHLFQHPFPPYNEKSAQDVAKLLPKLKEQASTATTTTHPLFMAPFTLDELKTEIQNFFPTNYQAPLESPTECYNPVTLISKSSFSSSSTFYENPTHNQQIGNFLSYNLSTKDTARKRQTQQGKCRPSILHRHTPQ